MKKILLFAFSLIISSVAVQAQTFAPTSGADDTVTAIYTGGPYVELHNNIASTSTNSVTLKWKVIAVNFGSGWDADSTGVCDNFLCRYNVNALLASSTSERSDPYTRAGDFHVLFRARNPAVGSRALVTVRLTDTVANYSRTLTFITYNQTTGITQQANDNSVSVYPNPARESINILFDRQSDVKTIAIYNMIGKTMRVFKPADNNSARLDLDNIPSGVYFVRLMNSEGQIVATRRFTRQ